MKALAKVLEIHPNVRIEILPKSTEKIRTLRFGSFQFLDSYAFLSSSLDKLVNDLAQEHTFPIINQIEDLRDLPSVYIHKKGVFPYEWCTSLSKLEKTKSFPPKDCFFSRLTNETITNEDYERGKALFQSKGFESMLTFCYFYNLLDTAILAEVFMKFREQHFSEFNLDPAHYISLAQLSFSSCLKKTGMKVLMISDPEMMLFVESSIRGGLSLISERICFAKNMGDTKQSLAYLDANNLYGAAMSRYLPVDEYAWENDLSLFDEQFILRQQETQDKGYFFEVTLSYPEDIQKDHRSFPLAPHHLDITEAYLSPYSKDRLIERGSNVSTYKSKKLVASFLDREYYICHYLNLKLCLELGLKLVRVHRVLSFKQAPILRPYIEYCTTMRSQSSSPFLKSYYKFLSNSIYGKAIENCSNRLRTKIVRNESFALNCISNPTFKGMRPIAENLCLSFHSLDKLLKDKPYLIGSSILELSKEFMQRSYYTKIRPLFLQCNVLFSDTDSFCLKILNPADENPMQILYENGLLDTSNYPKEHQLYDKSNCNTLNFFKDELKSKEMTAFVGLRSKLLSFKVKDEPNSFNTMKGVRRCISKEIKFQSFLDVLLRDMMRLNVVQHQIKAKNDIIGLQEIQKVAMDAFNDKAYQLQCGSHLIPYGDSQISSQNSKLECLTCEEIQNQSVILPEEILVIQNSTKPTEILEGFLSDQTIDMRPFSKRKPSCQDRPSQPLKRKCLEMVSNLRQHDNKRKDLGSSQKSSSHDSIREESRDLKKLARQFIQFECK